MPSVNDMRISTATGHTTFVAPVPFPTPMAATSAAPVALSHGAASRTVTIESASSEPVVAEHRPLMAALQPVDASATLPAFTMYSFTIEFADAALLFPDVPEGWSLHETAPGLVQVVHPVGRFPGFITAYGLSAEPKIWRQCAFGGSTLFVSYADGDLTQFWLNGVNSKTLNATGSSARVHVSF